jgi:DnaJ-class molecular chaperone
VDRRRFLVLCGAAAPALAAPTGSEAADPVSSTFTRKYAHIRERFLRDFEHHGQVAAWASGKNRTFSDQTLYMGFALLTFAGEARVLHHAGHDARPAEVVVRRLLQAYDHLEGDAVKARYKTTVPGFFLRDYVNKKDVNKKDWWPGMDVGSDFLSGDPDMSLDQITSQMMGWWGVSHWSTDAANRKLARAQAGRVMDYLLDERFWIDRPGTRSAVSRGADARAGAGFLCQMGEQITGNDYYHGAKVRLLHDNKCHTCGGTGLVNIPDPNAQCPACSGKGHCKIVLGGGRCQVCRGTGHVKIVVEADCPACSGSGQIRLVVTNPFTGDDQTIGSTNCGLCGGSGKIGGKTELGKCKVCGGHGSFPEYTKDLGKCKLCGGSGRLKGQLPKIKCPVCGGSKELNLYVTLTHPICLALEPVSFASLAYPRIGLHGHKVMVQGDKAAVTQSYVRHMNLVMMAFEPAVPGGAFAAAATDSNHPWAVALRVARGATVCSLCHGHGSVFLVGHEEKRIGLSPHFPRPPGKLHKIGGCKLCGGTGIPPTNPDAPLLVPLLADLVRLHRECPADGPGDHSPARNWCKDNRWVRCTDLTRGSGDNHYNGIDFLSLEVLLRLAGAGGRLD